jgi:hypothetical protein
MKTITGKTKAGELVKKGRRKVATGTRHVFERGEILLAGEKSLSGERGTIVSST